MGRTSSNKSLESMPSSTNYFGKFCKDFAQRVGLFWLILSNQWQTSQNPFVERFLRTPLSKTFLRVFHTQDAPRICYDTADAVTTLPSDKVDHASHQGRDFTTCAGIFFLLAGLRRTERQHKTLRQYLALAPRTCRPRLIGWKEAIRRLFIT